jgi:hypothetical protein
MLTPRQIADWEEQGLEVELRTGHGEVWLVPALTHSGRLEVTARSLPLLQRVFDLFPVAVVEGFHYGPDPAAVAVRKEPWWATPGRVPVWREGLVAGSPNWYRAGCPQRPHPVQRK